MWKVGLGTAGAVGAIVLVMELFLFQQVPGGRTITQHGKAVDPTAPLRGSLRFTTVGRSPYVDVVVPDAYQPAADALIDLTPAIRSSTTVTSPCR